MNRFAAIAAPLTIAALWAAVAWAGASTRPTRRAAAATQPASVGQETEERIKKLREALGMKPNENPLASAARRMGQVRDRLKKADGGLGTQEVQNQVVRDLDAIIAMMEKQSQRQGASAKQRKKQARSKARAQPKRKPSKGGAKGKQAMQDSTPTQGRAARAARGAVPRDAEKWGFLPHALREEVLQSFKEEFLPRFRMLIEEYYSTLSRRGRGDSEGTEP